jgi:hypothetical protein
MQRLDHIQAGEVFEKNYGHKRNLRMARIYLDKVADVIKFVKTQ